MPFDPDQPRDSYGRWTDSGSSDSAIKAAASDRFSDKVLATEEQAKEAMDVFKKIADRDEVEAVADYTYKPNEKYKDINQSYRNGEHPDGYETMIKNLDNFLNEAPKYGGETHRGLGFSSKEIYDKIKADFEDNFEFTDQAYGSTSTNRKKAVDYLKSNANADYAIILTVKGKNGVYLGSVSKTPDDQEVLFKHGTTYKIISMAEYDWKENGKVLNAVIEEK